MQTIQQSYADRDTDADPNRSLDAQVVSMLRACGLCFNPFQLTHSEGDTHLPAMLVRTPVAPQGSMARHVIYGEAGSGKTAKLLRYLIGMNAHYPRRRVLLVPFRAPPGGDVATGLAPALAQAFAAALFTTALVHAPAFTPTLADTLARAFDRHLNLPHWRKLIAGADQPEAVALMYDLVGMPRLPHPAALPAAWLALAQWPMHEADSAPANDAMLVELVELALAMGARSCVVLADDLDAPGRSEQVVVEWAKWLWNARRLHCNIEVQMFLPLTAREAVEQALGPHEAEVIQWDEAALRVLLARRLHVASDKPAMTMASLLGLSAKADEEMLREAAGSPRRLIALIRDVLEAQAGQAAAQMTPARKPEQPRHPMVNGGNVGAFQRPAEPPARPVPTPLQLIAARMLSRTG